ncbi:hypothetical protein Ddye_026528 [Dipteronia dyeriana]|uniref:Uncharacterized protein n=1 Tax=Dipteronia dyeriana TaxID=168575 RepID=A0AAD9WQK0_9ROSI|nr:hypothetical protein Ddye_026528 [Dipteronia dyeriana]
MTCSDQLRRPGPDSSSSSVSHPMRPSGGEGLRHVAVPAGTNHPRGMIWRGCCKGTVGVRTMMWVMYPRWLLTPRLLWSLKSLCPVCLNSFYLTLLLPSREKVVLESLKTKMNLDEVEEPIVDEVEA